jgi:hypothetical protein
MFDVVLPSNRVFDGICVPVLAADEALERSNVAAAIFATTRRRHDHGA